MGTRNFKSIWHSLQIRIPRSQSFHKFITQLSRQTTLIRKTDQLRSMTQVDLLFETRCLTLVYVRAVFNVSLVLYFILRKTLQKTLSDQSLLPKCLGIQARIL